MQDERTDCRGSTRRSKRKRSPRKQADAYSDWLDDRPEGVGEWFRFSYNPNAREQLEAKLDEAVEAGKITQEQADAALERFDEKAAADGRELQGRG